MKALKIGALVLILFLVAILADAYTKNDYSRAWDCYNIYDPNMKLFITDPITGKHNNGVLYLNGHKLEYITVPRSQNGPGVTKIY